MANGLNSDCAVLHSRLLIVHRFRIVLGRSAYDAKCCMPPFEPILASPNVCSTTVNDVHTPLWSIENAYRRRRGRSNDGREREEWFGLQPLFGCLRILEDCMVLTVRYPKAAPRVHPELSKQLRHTCEPSAFAARASLSPNSSLLLSLLSSLTNRKSILHSSVRFSLHSFSLGISLTSSLTALLFPTHSHCRLREAAGRVGAVSPSLVVATFASRRSLDRTTLFKQGSDKVAGKKGCRSGRVKRGEPEREAAAVPRREWILGGSERMSG